MADITSESVAGFISESVADLHWNQQVEQAVDDVGGLAGGWDRGRVVRRLAGGEVGIEERGRVAPVAGVDRAHGFAPAAGKKVLAIRAGNIGGPEQGGERLALLRIHQDRECVAVGFLTVSLR